MLVLCVCVGFCVACEVCDKKDLLIEPRVFAAFNCVGKVTFKEFVALEKVSNDLEFCLDYLIEPLWPYFSSLILVLG